MKRLARPQPGEIFRKLLSAYGPQGWWPVTPPRKSRAVYRPSFFGSLTDAQREEICLGAILTQNTSWTNVEKALAALRAAGVRRLADVERLPQARLAALIRPSGYFRQKARKLRVFARHARKRGGVRKWLAEGASAPREDLLSLWGVGPETADSILLYAGGRPSVVVDAYTLRLGRRLGWWRDAGYARAQDRLVRGLPAAARVYNEFHALIVEHAKRHCRAKPRCGGCPLSEDCAHGRRAARA